MGSKHTTCASVPGVYVAAIALYLAALGAAGTWLSRRAQTADDFVVAGRSLPARVLILTLLSTWIGSGSLFAGAGLGYRAGFPALWQSAGVWAGIGLMCFVAPRVRQLGLYTVPDILDRRYGAPARVLGALAIALAYTAIAGFQFRGGGRLLQLVAGIDPVVGAAVVAAFCIGCTALGGMLTVAAFDVFNGLTMLVGAGVAVGYLVTQAGGPAHALGGLRPDQLTLFGSLSPIAALSLALPTMCLLAGDASLYQKFSSARDERAARRATIGWLAGAMLVETLIVCLGLFGSAVLPGLSAEASETIVVRIALDVLPGVLGGVLLAGAAAIIVSTANSFLLTPATSLIHDVYRRSVNPLATDRQLLLGARVLVVALGVVAFALGNFFPTLLGMALWAYTIYGAGITPALIAAFVWPGATRLGGTASILVGAATTLLWELVAVLRGSVADPAYLFGVQPIYPALLLSISTLVAVSLTAPDPAQSPGPRPQDG